MSSATLDFYPDTLPAGSTADRIEQPLAGARSSSAVGASPAESLGLRVAPVRIIAGTQWIAGGRLREAILVRIEGEGSQLLAIHERSGIFGVGEDLAGAVNDLRAALLEHKAVLEASGPLSDDLNEQLQHLRQVLRDN